MAREALNELADLWLQSSDRNSLVAAAAEVDRQLCEQPGLRGVEVAEGLRKLSVPPIHVLYVVREADRIVEIETVKVPPT